MDNNTCKCIRTRNWISKKINGFCPRCGLIIPPSPNNADRNPDTPPPDPNNPTTTTLHNRGGPTRLSPPTSPPPPIPLSSSDSSDSLIPDYLLLPSGRTNRATSPPSSLNTSDLLQAHPLSNNSSSSEDSESTFSTPPRSPSPPITGNRGPPRFVPPPPPTTAPPPRTTSLRPNRPPKTEHLPNTKQNQTPEPQINPPEFTPIHPINPRSRPTTSTPDTTVEDPQFNPETLNASPPSSPSSPSSSSTYSSSNSSPFESPDFPPQNPRAPENTPTNNHTQKSRSTPDPESPPPNHTPTDPGTTQSSPQSVRISTPNMATHSFSEHLDIPFKIGIFSGKDDQSLENFIAKFERLSDERTLSDAAKAKWITHFVDGRAFKVLDALPEKDKNNYETIKTSLRLAYGHLQLPKIIAYPSFTGLKQGESERVQSYWERTLEKSNGLEVAPDQMMAHFVDGLTSAIKTYVLIRQPTTLNVAVGLAKEAEAVLPTDKSSLSSQINQLSVKLDNLANKPLVAATYTEGPNTKTQLDQNYRYNQKEPLKCQLCDGEGHDAKNCDPSHYMKGLDAFDRTNNMNRNFRQENSRFGPRYHQNQPPRRVTPYPPRNPRFNHYRPQNFYRYTNYPQRGNQGQNNFSREPQNQVTNRNFQPTTYNNGQAQTQRGDRNTPTVNAVEVRIDPLITPAPTPDHNKNKSVHCIPDKKNKMTIPVVFLNKNVFFLIDSGSSINGVNIRFLQTLPDIKIEPSPLSTLNMVDGSTSPIYGQIKMPIHIENDQYLVDFQVINCSQYSGILGRPFLIENEGVLDIGSQVLQIRGTDKNKLIIKLGSSHPTPQVNLLQNSPAHLLNTVNIPAYAEVLTKAKIKAGFGPQMVLLEDSTSLQNEHVLVAACVAHPTKDTVPVRMLNTTSCPIVIKQGSQVGRVSPLKHYYEGHDISETTLDKNHNHKKVTFDLKDTEHDDLAHPQNETGANCQSSVFPDNSDPSLVESDYKGPISSLEEGILDADFKTDNSPKSDVDFQINKDLSDTDQRSLLDLLNKYKDIFASTDEELGKTDLVEHKITLKEDKSIRRPPYRVAPKTREKICEQINKMMELDIIEESNSPFSSPVILVKKPDGTDRFCVDYRLINAATIKDNYSLPRLDDSIENLSGATYFSSLDLRQGYWQLPVAPESRQYTAFTTHEGLFHFKRLPFGLCNAPATFQRLMDLLMRGLKYNTVICYLDDLVVFSKSFSEHLTRLETVFLRLQKANLKLKTNKCFFAKQSIKFLGHIISQEGIKPSPGKIEVIEQIRPPKNQKNIKQFLGMAGFYRKFIPRFAEIAIPMTKLLRKNKPFVWDKECQESFDKLKQALTTHPILSFPDFKHQFYLFTDASGVALAGILGQQINDVKTVISYWGKTLNKAQQKYSVTELEALAVVESVKQFHTYLYGHKFTVVTDHSALKWLFTTKNLTGRPSRWALSLQEYDFEIIHRPGKDLQNADGLSRLQTPENEPNNLEKSETNSAEIKCFDFNGQKTMDQNKFQNADKNFHEDTFETYALNAHPYDPIKIKNNQRADPDLIQLILFLECKEPYTAEVPSEVSQEKCEDFILNEDKILYKMKKEPQPFEPQKLLVIPNSMKTEIIKACHDDALGGHFGIDRTLRKIKTKYWWPHMYNQIKDWIDSCKECMMRKRKYGYHPAPLQSVPIGLPFDRIAMDILGPLPCTTRGNRFVLLFVDYKTKWIEGCALKTTDSQPVAQALYDLIICRFGAPTVILSDRGSNFLSALMQELYKILNIKKCSTTAYRPQCDGMVERANSTLVQALSKYINKQQEDWDTFLNSIFFGIRTSVSASTGLTPFNLMMGRTARLPIDVSLLPPSKLTASGLEYRNFVVKNVAIAQSIAADSIEKAQLAMRKKYNQNTKLPTFQIGDSVLLADPTKKAGLAKKLSDHFIGPFTITEKLSTTSFKLNGLPKGMHNVVHADRLKLVKPLKKNSLRNEDQQHEPPNPANDTLEKEDQLDEPEIQIDVNPTPATHITLQPKETHHKNIPPVELNPSTPNENALPKTNRKILDHRRRRNRMQYLIKNLPDPDATAIWKRVEDINDPTLIESYLEDRKDRPTTRARKGSISTISIPPIRYRLNPTVFFIATIITIFTKCDARAPDLGDLYNCDVTQYQGAYALPPKLTCPNTTNTSEISAFHAYVLQYHPEETLIKLYHCEAKVMQLTCKDNFWGSKTYQKELKNIPVTKEECINAVIHKSSKFGKLKESPSNTSWTTTNHIQYKCQWMTTTTQDYFLFKVSHYNAALYGSDKFIHQKITQSVCKYQSFTCVPREKVYAQSIITWFPVKHRFALFRYLGKYGVKRIQDFVYIPALAIGGSITLQHALSMLLDTGYKLYQEHHTHRPPPNSTFEAVAEGYVTKSHFDVQNDLAEGNIGKDLLHTTETILHLAKSLCQNNKEMRQLQRWLVTTFPDHSAEYLFPEPGKRVEIVGDAIIVHSCRLVKNYEVVWSQSLKGKCYTDFPVQIPHQNEPLFLELSRRRLHSHGQTVKCPPRRKPIYIKGTDDKLWSLTPDNKFHHIKTLKMMRLPKLTKYPKSDLPKLKDFDITLLHYDKPVPSRLSLLKMIARNRENLESIEDIKTAGGGNIITGLGKALGTAITATAKGGSLIVKTIGQALHDTLNGVANLDETMVSSLSNATSNVIGSTSTGVSNIISSLGGVGNIVLWCLVILLYIFVIGSQTPITKSPFNGLLNFRSTQNKQNNHIIESAVDAYMDQETMTNSTHMGKHENEHRIKPKKRSRTPQSSDSTEPQDKIPTMMPIKLSKPPFQKKDKELRD